MFLIQVYETSLYNVHRCKAPNWKLRLRSHLIATKSRQREKQYILSCHN